MASPTNTTGDNPESHELRRITTVADKTTTTDPGPANIVDTSTTHEAPPATNEQDGGDEPHRPGTLHGFKLYSVAIGVCFGAFMMSLDISVISTAIPSITSDFGSTSHIAWYPAAYTFATCALTPLAGKLAAVFPLDRVYLGSSVVFLAGSVVCGAAPTSEAFIAGRAIAGAGAAGVASNGLTILVTIAPARKKPLFMGMGAGCFAIGLVLAPILGGAFTDRLTWRWCFWINLPFVAVTIFVIFLFFRPAQGRNTGQSIPARLESLDLIGCAIFVPAIFMLLLAMQRGGEQDSWDSSRIVGLFAGGGVTMMIFVYWERRKGDAAMIPHSVVMRRTVVFAVLFAFCHMGSLTIAAYYLPEWFQAVQGVSPLTSGVRMLPTVITQLITTVIASGLAIRIRYYNPYFLLAPVSMGVSSGLYTTFTVSTTTTSHWLGFQIIQGIGSGLGMQMSSLAVQLELKDHPELVPMGIAFVMFVQYLGATVLQVIAGTVFTNSLVHQLLGPAGLNSGQATLLLEAGTNSVRETTEMYFPELLQPVLEAYNTAITHVFFVPVAGACAAFLLAFGIKWNKLEGASTSPLAKMRARRSEKRQQQADLQSSQA
ncbi:putative HC-toxin efflux carrier TOXA [Zalerion maritima]|uniref:HC-toxin efflux carrier TOXA n=1 Tax=Zalerion maritima TaxID=339359 RepID=A0AAD5RT74_9PEZI|nr:putative HC-toxin efflux carrier TOXA [Zalerion maritima]